MGHHFLVHDLRRGESDSERDNANAYLRGLLARLHNAQHAQTRVFTCRSWRTTGGATVSYELYWNDESVPGEMLLGSCGWSVGTDLVERIEAEFAKGDAVRLFTFNSDADLIIEEVLEPLSRA